MENLANLRRILRQWTRWQRTRRTLLLGARGFAIGLGVAVSGAGLLVFTGKLLPPEFISFISITAPLGLLSGALLGWLRPLNEQQAARQFDHTYNLKERTSTALELAHTPSAWRAPLLADALHHARQIPSPRRPALRVPKADLLAILIASLLAIGIWYGGGSFFQQAQQQRDIEEAIALQTENLQTLIEEIANNPNLSEEQKTEIIETLSEALANLNQAENLEQAVTALNQAEQALQDLSDPQSEQLAQDLQTLGEQLAQSENDALSDLGEALAQNDLTEAANALENMNLDNMSDQELAETAEQLEQMAQQLAESNPELSQQLSDAAEALQNGDTQQAQQNLEQAADTLQNAQQQQAQNQAAQQASDQLAEAQQQLADNPQAQQALQNEQQAQQQQAQQQGQQQTEQQGQGQQGQGNGEGQQGGQATSQQGQASGSQGGNQTGQSGLDFTQLGDGGDSTFEPIAPSDRIDSQSAFVSPPASGEIGDNQLGQTPSNPANSSNSAVPYSDVFPEYSNTASEAINNGTVPPQYRALIRDYFSSLEP